MNSSTVSTHSPEEDLERIPISILLYLIFIVGLFGNLSVCIVIVRNKSMHTTVNYYLFSLAVSDMVIIFFSLLPWILNVSFAKFLEGNWCIVKKIASKLGYFASLFTITAVSVERYIAICHPFAAYGFSRPSRTVKVIFIIWLISFFLSVPKVIYNNCYGTRATSDDDDDDDEDIRKVNLELILLITYIITIITIVILYALMGLELTSKKMLQMASTNVSNQKKVVKMLVVVVLTLLLCWTPTRIHRFYYLYESARKGHLYMQTPLNYYLKKITRTLYYVISTTINPILYNLMSSEFRNGFKKTFLPNKCFRTGEYQCTETSMV